MSNKSDFIRNLRSVHIPEGDEQARFLSAIKNYVSGLNQLKNSVMSWLIDIPVGISVTECQAVAENYLYKTPYRVITITLTLAQNSVSFEPGPLFVQGMDISLVTIRKSVSGRYPKETFAQIYMTRHNSEGKISLFTDHKQTTELDEEAFFELISDLTLPNP